MPRSGLSELVAARSEDLGVEYKAWMDTSPAEARAKIARHIAALANHGGGYLVFGVDDQTRLPMGETELDRRVFDQDTIAGIVQKYLDPRVQVRVEEAEHDGVGYPVLVVPSHEGRPVIAIADGPQNDKKQPVGIRQGEIYVRAAGPQSVPIRGADQWNGLLDRCLRHRADLLGQILRQSIARPSRPSPQAVDLLLAAVDATAADFTAQTEELAAEMQHPDQARMREIGRSFSVLGYALVGDEGELIEIEGLRTTIDRLSVALHRYAYHGWISFLPLTPPERAPQVRTARLLGRDQTYLEGMRLRASAAFFGSFDYWRFYETGIAVTAESYREDSARARMGGEPYLTVLQVLFRLHSLLAHARLLGQETPGVQQVVVRMDWRGLKGRQLAYDPDRRFGTGRVADDRFMKTITLPWADLRDSYFASLRRVSLPILDMFPSGGMRAPEEWLTREAVEQELAKMQADTVRLFAD